MFAHSKCGQRKKNQFFIQKFVHQLLGILASKRKRQIKKIYHPPIFTAMLLKNSPLSFFIKQNNNRFKEKTNKKMSFFSVFCLFFEKGKNNIGNQKKLANYCISFDDV